VKITVINSIKKMQKTVNILRESGKKIGFVPTMGYLHQGHISLAYQSKKENDATVMSIYVNPLQFGANEDFSKYPRDFKKDEMLAAEAGINYIFYPSNKIMYSENHLSYIDVDNISKTLEGECRPGHFRGVTTVVAKLFNIVKPHTAYFGQKDAQQAYIIKKMTNDLNFDIKIRIMPVIRDKNGIALSSRNVFLTDDTYPLALQLSKTLRLGKQLIQENKNILAKNLLEKLYLHISEFSEIKVDYIAVRDYETFTEPEMLNGKNILLIAARIGTVRLIDNIIINNGL